MFIEKRNFLEPTCIDSSSLEHRVIHVADARIDIRLGKHLEEVGYDELSSSEVDEPVGDDGDARIIFCHLLKTEQILGLVHL